MRWSAKGIGHLRTIKMKLQNTIFNRISTSSRTNDPISGFFLGSNECMQYIRKPVYQAAALLKCKRQNYSPIIDCRQYRIIRIVLYVNYNEHSGIIIHLNKIIQNTKNRLN